MFNGLHGPGRRLLAAFLVTGLLAASASAVALVQPVISGFTPASGPVGTQVTVTGTGFTGADRAAVSYVANIPVIVDSDRQVRFTIPANCPSGTVGVFNAQYAGFAPGAGFTVSAAQPNYPQPLISSFSPSSGPVGTIISVNGTGFTGVNEGAIGDPVPQIVPVSVLSDTLVRLTVSASAVSGSLRLRNPQRAAFSPGTKFTVTPGGGTTGSTGGGSTGGTTGGTSTGGTTTGGSTTGGTTGGGTTGGATTGGTGGSTTGATTGGATTGATGGGGTAIGTTEAARFLSQATFGAKLSEINSLAAQTSFEGWLSQQRTAPPTLELPYLLQREASGATLVQADRIDAWFQGALNGPDPLRQRMAFALSEILVVSELAGALNFDVKGLATYYDFLIRDGLGNFRTILENVTLSPQMGLYLSTLRNQKPDPANGIRSDENYAREVMQLFTVGLNQLNVDGSIRFDAGGRALPTYSQTDVENLARVFTGFGPGGGSSAFDFTVIAPNRLIPMSAYQAFHDTGAKTIIGNTAIAGGQQALPELRQALDVLFNHPNVGPFIGRQLIRKLVTANPSPAYVQHVASAFNDNGSGVRGDLYAVARAILTDPEARAAGGVLASPTTFGKLREPLLRLTQIWRAFDAAGPNGRYSSYDNPQGAFVQAPLRAPSVFNFFRPDYQPVGAIADAGLASPEFQITDEASISEMVNEINYLVLRYRSSANPQPNPTQVVMDFRPWEQYAANATTLVDQMNLVLMSGRMPAAMRTELINYANLIPLSEGAAVRVSEVLYLLVTSAQYSTQR